MKKILNFKSIMTLALLLVFALGFAGIVKANPSLFQTKQSTSATTSPTYLVQGTAIATTTFAFDVGQGNFAVDSGTLLVQMTASSTSQIKWRYEYSQGKPGVDCVTNEDACDWYSDNLMARVSTSTTPGVESNISVPFTQVWTFASSSDLCVSTAVIATNNRGCKAFEVKTPTRYMRTVVYSTSSTRSAVYMEYVNKKEVNSN